MHFIYVFQYKLSFSLSLIFASVSFFLWNQLQSVQLSGTDTVYLRSHKWPGSIIRSGRTCSNYEVERLQWLVCMCFKYIFLPCDYKYHLRMFSIARAHYTRSLAINHDTIFVQISTVVSPIFSNQHKKISHHPGQRASLQTNEDCFLHSTLHLWPECKMRKTVA